ncbi:hypothetical protein [Methylobacterium sp. A54F]
MAQYLGIGIGAGLVSALLFGVLLKATPLAILLYLLAPLPILIVGLGWSHKAALAAAATGSIALALVVQPFLGLGYGAYLALPAWWLAYLTLLGRPRADGVLEWYPTGRLLGWIATTAALAFMAIAVIASPSYDAFDAQLRDMGRSVLRMQNRGAAAPAQRSEAPETSGKPAGETPGEAPAAPAGEAQPEGSAQAEVGAALARVVPAFATHGLTLLLTFYLWASARIVQVSGRLPRPWPDLPATVMPRGTLGLFAAAIALSFVPGYPGVLGLALGGALSAAFALQGLCAFHDRSRGRTGRPALLLGLYLILFVTQGVALFALTLFGLADTALDRRRPRGGAGTL